MEAQADRRWSWKLGRLFASLAKRLNYPVLAAVPISAAMLSHVDAVSPDQTLADAARLVARGASGVAVIDHGRALGVMTREALTHALVAGGPRATVASASRRAVVTVDPSESAVDVLARLRELPDASALVVDHGDPVGLLTAEQIAAYLASLPTAA